MLPQFIARNSTGSGLRRICSPRMGATARSRHSGPRCRRTHRTLETGPRPDPSPGRTKREWITHARTLHVDGHDTEAAALAACWAREAGIPVVADLDDLYSGVEALLPNIDYLITSRDIPERLCGERDLHKSLPEVRERFGCRITGATLGHDGVLAWDGSQFHYAPAFQVETVDTTGAGTTSTPDFFTGFCKYGRPRGSWISRVPLPL